MSIHQARMNTAIHQSNTTINEEEDKSEVVPYGNWYEIFPRRINQSRHSTPGLLMMSLFNGSIRSSFIYLTQSGQIQISDFSHNFKNYYWSSCNGFMLKCVLTLFTSSSTSTFLSKSTFQKDELKITNPATNQNLHLPPFIDPTQPSSARSAVAYVATRMEYKVVRTYLLPRHTLRCFAPQRINCAILTVGVDNAWRLVDTQHLSLDSCQQLQVCPLVTEGFAHWIKDWFPLSNGFVLTLNMETETMTRYVVPRCIDQDIYYKYFSTGESNLSLLIARGHFQFIVWEMNSETGEWTSLFDIDLGAHEALFNESYDRDDSFKPKVFRCRLYPTGWLKYREVIVFDINMLAMNSFHQTTSIVVYNVQTQVITVLKKDHKTLPPYLFHRDNQHY